MMSLAVPRPLHGDARTRQRRGAADNQSKVQPRIHRTGDYDALVTRFPSATANGVAILVPDQDHVDKTYLDETGFDRPLLMRSPTQVDIQVPAQNSMGLKELAAAIGSERRVRAIDVASQRELENEWTLGEWMQYFSKEPTKRDRVLNLISLECSGSKLDKIVRPPKLVREIGWVEKHWASPHGASTPLGKKERMVSPKVQLYCLMSAAGSYTEFHIDFGGSSVWYHLYKGRKYFFVIPPTEENVKRFTEWENTYQHSQAPFFGDLVAGACSVVEMRAGDTLLLPSGWIHAVYTPDDSISFGGNFLSGYHMQSHLNCHEREKKQHVEGRFFFPEFESTVWYAAVYYAKMLATCPSILSKWEWQGLQHLVTALQQWMKTDGKSDRALMDRVIAMCKAAVHSSPEATLEKMATAVDKKLLNEKEALEAKAAATAPPLIEKEESEARSTAPDPSLIVSTSLSADLTATSSSSSSSSSGSSSPSSDSSILDSSDDDTGKDSDGQPSAGGNDDEKDIDTNSDSDSSSDESSSSSSSSSSDDEEEAEREPEVTAAPAQPKEEEQPDRPEESSSSESDNSSDPEGAYPELPPIPVDALISLRKRDKQKELQITKTEKVEVIARARQNFLERQTLGSKKKKNPKKKAMVDGVAGWVEDEQWNVECSCGLGGLNYDDGRLMVQCENCSNWVHGDCVSSPLPETFWCFKCRADDEQWYFSCPCGVKGKNADDGFPMVECDKCGVWQHIACTLNPPIGGAPEPDSYICTSCVKPLKKQKSSSQTKTRVQKKSKSKKKSTTKIVVKPILVPPISNGVVSDAGTLLPPLPASPPPPALAPPPPPPPSAPPSPSSQATAVLASLSKDGASRQPRKRARSTSSRTKRRGKKSKPYSDDDEDPLSPVSSPPSSDGEAESRTVIARPPLPHAGKTPPPPPSTATSKRKNGESARDRLAKKLKIRKPRG